MVLLEYITGGDNMMTSKEVMDYFKISKSTLQRWKRAGCPFKNIGYRMCRYDLKELIEWVENKQK